MTRVQLGVARQGPAPVRYPMTVAALEVLARRTGALLPWAHVGSAGASLARALGDAAPATTGPASAGGDGARELSRLGLVDGDDVHADAVTALDGFTHPLALVDLELGVRSVSGTARLRSWQRRHVDGITAVTAAGHDVELAWWPVGEWPAELARTVAAPPAGAGARATRDDEPGPPAAYLRLPYELLLASGAALREGRSGVLAELLERHRGRVTGRDRTVLAPASVADQVVRLHTGERGRLQVSVTGSEPARRGVGLVTWVLFDDGWRELMPAPGAGEPYAVVRSVAPTSLGGTVARVIAAVA